ncbi:MAG: serine/threonine protein kinase [Lentisphaerales bacterium]|nr:serine/threonine protein kinase [Lentisphaerales bacterium]
MSCENQLAAYYNDDDKYQGEDELNLSSPQRYTDFQKLSSGGMKNVFKVFDNRSQRFVAYARLKNNISDVLNETFVSEARLTAKLNHPNIIPIYDVGIDDQDRPFFTMELKAGDSLNDVIKKLADDDPGYKSKYSRINLLNIFVKVCDAVAYAHSQKVIHLDLKPANIQIGNYGEVMVCDWGLSKVYEKQFDTTDINQLLLNPDLLNTMTVYGEIKGSPGFMAPEQILPDGVKDVQTDVFSLGCVLYSLLSCKTPFTGSLEDVLEKTVKGNSPELKPELPRSLVAITQKAMAVDKSQRYENVQSLKKDVENYLHGYATVAENASFLKLFKLLVLRNRLLSSVIISALSATIIGSVLFFVKINAEKKLALQQKAISEEALKEKQSALLKINKHTFHNNFYESPARAYSRTLKGLKEQLKNNPDSEELNNSLGHHYFVGQKFTEAKKHLTLNPVKNADLLQVVEQYIDVEKQGPFLGFEDFKDLLQSVDCSQPVFMKMFLFYAYKNRNEEQVVDLIKVILEDLNPNWSEKKVIYESHTKTLHLEGRVLSRFSSWRTPLHALDIDHLILHGTDIKGIKVLGGLGIKTLDIAKTSVPMKDFRSSSIYKLKLLIVNESQFSSKGKILREGLEIKLAE